MQKEEKYLTATQVSYALNTRVDTIATWYKWYRDPEIKKPPGTPPLPDYTQHSKGGPKYWKAEDLPLLIVFKNWVPKGRNGLMGKYNKKKWGKNKCMNTKE